MDCRKKYGWSEETCESVMESIFREDEENAVRIMLAKQGYLAYMDASSGCCKSLRTNSRLETEIIIWCAEELKRHGVEEKFIPQEGGLYGIRTDEPGMGWEI